MSDSPRPPSSQDVRFVEEDARFILDVEGEIALIDIRRAASGGIAMVHTGVPKSLEGRGVGSALVRGALDMSRAKGQKVLPFCPFIHAYIKRHPEYLDLVDPSYPRIDSLTD